MSLELLMSDFKNEIKKQQDIIAALPNPKYQQSVILDRLIWEQEKVLKDNEQLPYSRNQAYFEATIPQYFLK